MKLLCLSASSAFTRLLQSQLKTYYKSQLQYVFRLQGLSSGIIAAFDFSEFFMFLFSCVWRYIETFILPRFSSLGRDSHSSAFLCPSQPWVVWHKASTLTGLTSRDSSVLILGRKSFGHPRNSHGHTSLWHATHAIHVAFSSGFVYLKTLVNILLCHPCNLLGLSKAFSCRYSTLTLLIRLDLGVRELKRYYILPRYHEL